MSNRTFIERFHNRAVKRDVTYGTNLIKSTDGNIYSYGYHYPLLIDCGDFKAVNTMGYSSSTGQHIGHARRYADIEFKVPNGNGGIYGYMDSEEGQMKDQLKDGDSGERVEAVRFFLGSELSGLNTRLSLLSARAWRQREDCQAEISEVELNLSKLARRVIVHPSLFHKQ